jgi:hypothetical protein
MNRDEGGPIPAEWKLRCLECGYDLTGLPTRVCPECGQPFKPRETWEANQAGDIPRSEVGRSRVIHLLIMAAIVAVSLAIGQLAGDLASGLAVAAVIIAGEIWIFTSDVRPFLVRIMSATLCIFLILRAVL